MLLISKKDLKPYKQTRAEHIRLSKKGCLKKNLKFSLKLYVNNIFGSFLVYLLNTQ